MREITGSPSVSDLIRKHGSRIAHVVRGDTGQLAESECNEVLQSRISYYANDLTVIGWNAAFLYDSTTGAETAIQLLEYANSQLLEFRHYDDLLTENLIVSTNCSIKERAFLRAGDWRAPQLGCTRCCSMWHELTEHADNAIKFLSDMFAARLYKLAASKVGVPDYKDLVTRKVHTAEELYRFMVDQFNQSRAFVLELMVVIILIIDLIWLFKGSTADLAKSCGDGRIRKLALAKTEGFSREHFARLEKLRGVILVVDCMTIGHHAVMQDARNAKCPPAPAYRKGRVCHADYGANRAGCYRIPGRGRGYRRSTGKRPQALSDSARLVLCPTYEECNRRCSGGLPRRGAKSEI